jgi:outer membrane lipoprotein LolB
MRVWWLALLVSALMAGCATPSRTAKLSGTEQTNSPEWQGRISVQVQGDKPSSMSASFLLRGNAKNGELDLYSPLGTTLGALQWTPQLVQLSDGGKHQYFNSLAELTEKTTGAALPVDAIFGWLQGRDVQAPGWQADLSGATQGSLSARRTNPAPEVTLRIKLDQ